MIKKLTRKSIRGVGEALIVPWDDRDELDKPQFRRDVAAYGGTGVSGA
jgi:hypothetical protein